MIIDSFYAKLKKNCPFDFKIITFGRPLPLDPRNHELTTTRITRATAANGASSVDIL